MSDKKTHTIQLGNAPKEEVAAAELEAVKKATGQRFHEYDVQPLQPEKPADLTAAPSAPRTSRALPAATATSDEPK